MHRNAAPERRAQSKLANFLGLRNVADIENHNGGAIAQIGFLSVLADDRRPVEGDIFSGRLFSIFLTVHPPASGFLRLSRIADVEKHQDLPAKSGHTGRETCIFSARITDPMDSRGTRFPLREVLPIERIADVPDQDALVIRPVRIAAPGGLLLLEGGQHEVVVKFHLDGVGVVGAGDELYEFRIFGVGDIEDCPAAMPFVAHEEIPPVIHVLDGHLERAAAPVEAAVANRLQIACFPSCGNLVGRGAHSQ